MKILIAIFLLSFTYVKADNLNTWMLDVQNKTSATPLPALPKIKQPDTKLIIPVPVNIFSANRLNVDGKKTFELDKLSMVGYLNFKNKDYAFIQTPIDTRKLMVGESIGQASVLQIGKDFVILNEQQQMNGRVFNNKVYLKLVVESQV